MKTLFLLILIAINFQLVFGQEEPKQQFSFTNCTAENIVFDKSDNLLVGGNYDISSPTLNPIIINNVKFGVTNRGFFCAKLNQKSEILWVRTLQTNAPFLRYPAPVTLVDDSSNVYLIGKFEQKIFIDSNNILDAPTGDIFIIKYSAEGLFRWAKKIVGSSDNGMLTPKIDSNGNIFILGQFEKRLEFDGQQRLTTGSNQPFILKIDRNGKYVFAKAYNENLKVNALTINDGGEMFIVGEFYGNVVFENNTLLKSSGFQDIFYAKYDKNLKVLWVKTISGKIEDVSHNIEADKLGNIYIAGLATNDAVFDTSRVDIQTTKGRSIFLSKIEANSGNVKWIKRIAYGDDTDPNIFNTIKQLKLNNLGEVYMNGNVAAYLNPDSKTKYVAGSSGGLHYIVKYNINGDFLFGFSNPINNLDRIVLWKSIAVDSKSKLYFTGYSFPSNISNGGFNFINFSPNLIKLDCSEKPKVNIEWNKEKIFISESIMNLSDFHFQWYKNGEYIPNGNNATFQAKETGNYSLKLTNKTNSSCQVSSSNSINILPLALSTPAILNFNAWKYPYLYTDEPAGDKIEWYFNDKLIRTTTTTILNDVGDGVYKIKKYFANNTIIKESNEVNVQRGLGICISKDIIYDDGDVCKPMPFLKINFAGNPISSKTAGVQITWFFNGEIIKDSTDVHLKVVKPGDYQVKIVMDTPPWDFISGKYKIVAEDFPKSLAITKIEDICGAKALLKVDDSFIQRYGFQSIIWRVDDKVIPEATQPFYNANKGGFYTFSLQYNEPTTGKTCTYNSFINFEKKNDFKLNLGYAYAGSGCVVDSFKVFTEQNPKYTYTWTKNDIPIEKQSTNEIFIKDKARYKGIVRRNDGCVNETDEISLKGCTSDENERFLLLNPPQITADKTRFFNNEKALLSFEGCSNVNIQWLKNDQMIAGATQENLEVKDGGNYTLQIEKFGCKTTTNTIKISVETILAIGEEKPDFNIEVYPNPVEESLFVSIPAQINTPIDVKMTDISGKLISSYDFSTSNSQFIDLKSLQVGVYFLVFDMQGKRVVKKIIKNS